MGKENKNYVRITDKNKLAYGRIIYINLGYGYNEHKIRKRLIFESWEETVEEYQENYVKGWLIPMFKNGFIYELVE